MKPTRLWVLLSCALLFAVPFCAAGTPRPPETSARPPALFIAGDSTAAAYESEQPRQGWGAVLQSFFDPNELRVVNAARSGRSSRTFISEGHWDRLLAQARPGDFVILQFGHNDSRPLNEEPPGSNHRATASGSIPGIGDEAQEIDNVVTRKHETVHTFGWYLRKMIADTRARGATPILMPPTKTNVWNGRGILCPAKTYRLWTYQVAMYERVPFVDLARISADRYQRMGRDAVAEQFVDNIHTSALGAEAIAEDVVSGLRSMKDAPFDGMLSESGRRIAPDPGPTGDSRCEAL